MRWAIAILIIGITITFLGFYLVQREAIDRSERLLKQVEIQQSLSETERSISTAETQQTQLAVEEMKSRLELGPLVASQGRSGYPGDASLHTQYHWRWWDAKNNQWAHWLGKDEEAAITTYEESAAQVRATLEELAATQRRLENKLSELADRRVNLVAQIPSAPDDTTSIGGILQLLGTLTSTGTAIFVFFANGRKQELLDLQIKKAQIELEEARLPKPKAP